MPTYRIQWMDKAVTPPDFNELEVEGEELHDNISGASSMRAGDFAEGSGVTDISVVDGDETVASLRIPGNYVVQITKAGDDRVGG